MRYFRPLPTNKLWDRASRESGECTANMFFAALHISCHASADYPFFCREMGLRLSTM